MRGVPGQAEAQCPAVAELEETTTNTELMNLKAALRPSGWNSPPSSPAAESGI
jgi:hypothetical protein